MRFGEKAAKEILRETEILEDDEEIIWARTPEEKAYRFTTKLYGSVVFFTIWLMLSPLNMMASDSTGHLMLQGIWITAGLISAGITVYLRIAEKRVEAYALTNQRVIHYYHSALGFKQNVDDLYLEQIVDVDMSKTGITAKLFDIGKIFFSRRGSQSATSGGGAGSSVAFSLVSQPKDTHQSLRRTIIKEVGGGALSMKDIDSYRKGKSLKESSEKKGEADLPEISAQLEEIKELLQSIDRKL